MPDLITHTTAAYFVVRPKYLARHRAVFYLGTILPDVLSRPIYIFFPKAFEYTLAIHTPIFTGLFCVLIAQFFEDRIRKPVLFNLLGGVALHFLLDLFQRHLVPGYNLLFPFSWWSFEIGWFWPEQPLRLIPLWILAVVFTEIILWRYRKHKK